MDSPALNTQAVIEAVAACAAATDALVLLKAATAYAAPTGKAAQRRGHHYVRTARADGPAENSPADERPALSALTGCLAPLLERLPEQDRQAITLVE